MRKGNLNREQGIEAAGIKLINKLERENCEFTNRVQTDGDSAVEFSSSVKFIDNEGDERILLAYYYQEQEDLNKVEELDQLEWEIQGYEIY